MAKGKSKNPTVDLKDVVSVKDEPLRKPIRVLTQEQVLDRFQVSRPCYLEYERRREVPRARTICGKTVYIEHEVEECILTSPFRKLKGDAE